MKSLILLAVICTAACGSSPSPVAPAPTPPPLPACQQNNTASVRFENRSGDVTQDIFWDGTKLATLAPGRQSDAITVAAGVAHRLEFRVTNSSFPACNVANPIPAQCAFPLYFCSGPQ